jgi:hypothetical protein
MREEAKQESYQAQDGHMPRVQASAPGTSGGALGKLGEERIDPRG